MLQAIPLPVRGRADTPGVAGTSRLACEHAGGSHLSEEKASGKQEESIKEEHEDNTNHYRRNFGFTENVGAWANFGFTGPWPE